MGKYDNNFGPGNSYGGALALLVEHRQASAADETPAIHLDLGCGYAHIAKELVRATGLGFVGVDPDGEAVASLRERGFEAHQVGLGDTESTLADLRKIVAGRRVASISLLDVLEHLTDAAAPMAAVATLAAEHAALVVLSVPNVTHADVGLKLVFGRWDVTETGLLDETHVRFYTRQSLEQALQSFGLYKFDESNVEMARSDQHYPLTHPALGEGTSLHRYLTALRRDAARDEYVNQFVWICTPGPRAELATVTLVREPDRPFLSVVIRTQASRIQCLREVFTCLAAQTCQDFEVVLVAHKVNVDQQIAVERLVEDTPLSLRSRIRLVVLDRGRRSAPLNVGFAASAGRYIAVLDDDDIVFGPWVETFASMERRAAGRMLRTVSVPQRVDVAAVFDRSAARAIGPLLNFYPHTFDFVEHLRDNYTPNTAVAFPRGVFHDLGQRFDEGLSTTEDWDFMMRVASIVGVESSPTVTCIYRWWVTAESSRTVHDRYEWLRNNGAIFKKFDESEILFPAGSARRIREILQEVDQLQEVNHLQEVDHLRAVDAEAQAADGARGQLVTRRALDLLREIQAILDSTSWRASAPLRLASRLVGRGRRITLDDYFDRSEAALAEVVASLRASRSWRITRRFRR